MCVNMCANVRIVHAHTSCAVRIRASACRVLAWCCTKRNWCGTCVYMAHTYRAVYTVTATAAVVHQQDVQNVVNAHTQRARVTTALCT
jgi:hypothetical protein